MLSEINCKSSVQPTVFNISVAFDTVYYMKQNYSKDYFIELCEKILDYKRKNHPN